MKNITNSLTCKAKLLVCALLILTSYKGFSQAQNVPAISPDLKPSKGLMSSADVDPDIKNMLNYYDKQVYFTENKGQWDSKALYRADFHLGQAVATKEGMIVATYDPANTEAQSKWDEEQEAAHTHHIPFTQPEPRMKGNSWMMNFINHSPLMTVEGNTKHNDAFNYFNGSQSQTDVNSYQEIWYNNVYDNVDVRYYPSKNGSLEYDMICKPGFDKNSISIKMDGISKVILKKDGSLGLKTSVGEMSLPTPIAYQNINGQRVSVEVHYVVSGDNIVTFNIGNFDAYKPLLIDPIALRWASWLNTNSTGANHAHCVWIDAAGNIYTVSRVQGTTNLITGPFDTTANGSLNMIIAEYNDPDNVGGSGTRVWQTYVGGNNDNNPYAAQMGPDGNLYITGYTSSTNFPLIGGTAFSGPSLNEESQTTDNIFVMKITPDGKSVKGAVIGGNGDDESYDLRFTSTGDVLVCGETESSNLATLYPGTGASNTNSGNYDVLVFRINSNLDTIKWMKNYGGSSTDVATIMVDNPVTDDIYVAGYTSSSNFPTLKPRQSAIIGSESGFIEKLNSSGTTKWASYFDAASSKVAQILCMEFNTTYDELYFGGVTTGLDTVSKNGSNISKGAYQTKYGGSTDDFFVASMDTNQTFVAGTYVGGNGQEINMMGLNTDQNNDVYILGYTSSTNFPTTSGALQTTNMASSSNDNEVFLKLYTTLDSLEYSTYYGGSTDDYDPVGERGIKFSNCRIYTLVTSESNNIPLTKGALNTTKLSASSIYEPGLLVWSNPPDLLNNTITGSQFVCKGNEPTSFTGSVPSYSLPTISRNNVYTSYPSIGSSTVYQWQSSTDSINWTNVAGGTTQNLDSTLIGPLSATTYFRRVISGDACIIAGVANQTITVQNSGVSATIINVSCNGSNNGSITAIPTGPSPYTFTWTTTPVQKTATASNLASGTYTVTVNDGAGCTYSNSFVVTQPAVLAESIASQSNPTGCNGTNGSVTANAATGGTPPYTYAWAPSGGTGLTASNLSAGTYTITATDSNKCTATATVVITSPVSTLTASITSQTNACFGDNDGSATVTASDGAGSYTYSWNTVPVQTGATATGLAAGTYTVIITDANTCTTTATAIITQPNAALSASVSSQSQNNVSCFAGNNGSASVSVSGGTPGYSYSWNTNPAQTKDTAVNLAAGTYTVTVTDANNCTATATAIITQPNAVLSASVSSQSQNNVSCFGGNNGSASASVSGGTQPYSYSWNSNPVQTSDTASNLAAGTYTVTVTDANNCTATATAIIIQPQAALSASVSSQSQNNVSCFGGNNGSASASVSGGTQPYSYSWNTNPVQTSDTATNLAAGTYTVTVTDANNCTATATAIITQPQAALSASVSSQSQNNVSCFGGNNGSASASVSGGTKPYSYSWNTNPVQTSDTATNLAAGTYTVTVTDANNCTATATAIIIQPQAALSASVSSQSQNNVSCFGGNNGSASASVSGGTQPYSYSWNSNPVQTSDIASNLAAGTYTVTVTDANNCTATATAIITQPNAALSASVSSQSQNNVSCFGGNNGSAIASVSGGTQPYSYSWNSNPVQTSDTATNLAAGTYTVTVTDANNCTATATAIIIQPQAALSASVSSQSQNNVSCFGGNNGSASASVSGGTQPYSYSWNSNPVQTSDTASNLAAGTYTVTVTDANNCSATATAIITQPNAALSASVSSQSQNNVSCFGGNNGSAIASVSGGTQSYSYSWNTNPVQTSDTATNLAAGTYTVTVTDANNCTATATAIIIQPQAALSASVSSQSQNNVSCFGGNNGSASASVSGGTQPYSYSWNTNPVQTSDTATNLAAGTYTVTVTDANNCTATATAIITQPQAALSASIATQTNVSCFGGAGSASVMVNGGTQPYSYSWNSNPAQTTDTASNLSAGTYTVTVTDANNCTTTATSIITQPVGALSASISSQSPVLCFGGNNGSAIVTASAGTRPYSYSWNTNPVQTSDTAFNLSAGTYMVTVTDSVGCMTTAMTNITQPQSALSATISSQINVSCFGGDNGSATVTVSGGTPIVPVGGTNPYNYSWNTNPVQTTSTATNLPAGTYTVTVTDSNNCTTTATVVITQPQAALGASIASQINVTCFGGAGSASVSANGGTHPYSYSWNTNPVQTGDTATNLAAGTYTVTVTDSNNCTTTASVTIIQPVGALSASITSQSPVLCFEGNNGSAIVTASAGTAPYTYSWNTIPVQTSDTAINLAAGTYTVTVNDSAGCVTTAVAVIAQPQTALSASVTAQTNVLCNSNSTGSATATALGGTYPYSYSWNTSPVQTGATANNLAAGTYTVTVTDQNNCTTTATAVVTQPQAGLSVAVSASSTTVCSSSPTTLSASVSGGTGNYVYNWSPGGATTDTITVNPSATATYSVTVTDSNGCTSNGAQTVNVNQLPQVSISAGAQPICMGTVDTLKASGAINYTWTPSAGIIGDTTGAVVTASPTAVVTYTVTGTDGNGCSNTATTSVNVNKLPTVSLNGLNPTYCSNASTVTLEGVPPAVSPYGVYSGNSVNGQNFSPDSAGVGGPYTITYTYIDDTTGCKNSASVPVTILAAPNVTITPDSPAVCSGISVTLQAYGAESYSWSPATGLSNTSGSSVTTNTNSSIIYTVMGTDSNGCSNTAFTDVAINVLPVVTITPNNPNICLGNSVTLNAAGGTTYSWSPSTGLSCTTCSTTIANPTSTTQYIVDASNGKCSASDTITVGVYSVTVKAGPDQHILYGSTAQLTASGADFYVWTPGNTLSNDSISDPIASPTVTTTYTVTGYDSLGCSSTDTVVIYVSNPCESLKIPNAFTPAGTENRFFHVLNLGGVSLQEFKVFNRWGQQVYETTNINDRGWDGTLNGKEQPMGTYVYYTEVLCEGKIVFIKGDVTLLR